jgi:hypothetical protein
MNGDMKLTQLLCVLTSERGEYTEAGIHKLQKLALNALTVLYLMREFDDGEGDADIISVYVSLKEVRAAQITIYVHSPWKAV